MKEFIKGLIENGYRYIFIPKGFRKKFYATMTTLPLCDDDIVDTLEVENEMETQLLKILPKQSFISLVELNTVLNHDSTTITE